MKGRTDMKKYIYLQCTERELNDPQIFESIEAARMAMRKDFLEIIGEDTVEIVKDEENIDLKDSETYYVNDTEFGIQKYDSWVSNTNFGNWDSKICEIEI